MNSLYRPLYTLILTLTMTLGCALQSKAAQVLPELESKYLSLVMPSVSAIEKDHWYVMYNVGRKGFLCDDESKLHITTAPPSADAMKYLVRITDVNGRQVVQTGIGRYFKYLTTSSNSGTTTSAGSNNAFTYGTIEDGYFWLKDNNGMVLDANALGSAIDAKALVAGWGKDTPTSTTGNNSWRFFSVELIDASDEMTDVPYAFGTFSFQSVHDSKYLYYDSTNLGLAEEEKTASAMLTVNGTWNIGVAEGAGQNTHIHIGTEGKFSAGPVSPMTLYRVTEVDGLGYVYAKATSIIDGATYLIVGEHEGSNYALLNIIDKGGTSNQRMLSSQVTFRNAGSEEEQSIGLLATFTGSNAADVTRHHWQFHYGESLIQEPFVYSVGETGGASGSGKPLLTIACVSDIHTQEGWLCNTSWDDKDNGYYKAKEIKDLRIRESLEEAVKALKKEDVDVLIVGGDCQSDATVDEEHWREIRRLMATALRSVKTDAKGTPDVDDIPVLYVNGNHEYEVASNWGGNGNGYYNWRYTRPFNAGEYYDFPMISDVGTLAADYDCFYENAPNDALLTTKKTMRVLAAYHYNIKGFDFVVLNCGKHLFHNANNYSYSDESVEWIARKLQHIYADDPTHTKPVFFALHIPFGDSNSVNTSEDKGMSYFDSTHRLKQVLAQYPGLVMLYGHDHGQDFAYIRSKTSQRVTRYDSNGHVMATTDGVDSFDKDLTSGEPMKAAVYKGQSVLFHPYSANQAKTLGVKGTYLAASAAVQRNLALLDTPNACTIYPESNNAISLRLGDGSQHLVYNNGFGISSNEHQNLRLLHVKSDGTHFTFEPVQKAEDGELYLIASVPASASDPFYIYKVGTTRSVTPADDYSVTTFSPYFWCAELPAEAQPSFVSSFMGSMRYYNNSNGEPANSSYGTRKLIQGLIIYVYPDRIVFNMKNFRNNAGARVRNELAPYVVKRAIPDHAAANDVVPHNASGAYYRRVDDLSQLSDKAVCLLVDESRKRSIGIASNATGKFQAVEITPNDGVVEASRNASECEFVVEKKPEGAAVLPNDAETWYIRTHDGYIKSAESKILHRQQSANFYTSNPLCNEVLKAAIVPWTFSIDDNGVVNVESRDLGPLKKFTTGMTTGTFHLYQKVVPAQIDAESGMTAFYAEHALQMPEGVEAYTVGGLNDDGTLHFVRQTTKVPAKTGLVLRSTLPAKDPNGTLEIPVIDDRYAPRLANYLDGTLAKVMTTAPMDADAADDYSFYLFVGASFVATESNAGPFINNARRAYLALPYELGKNYISGNISNLLNEAEVNGIKDVIAPSAVDANAPIYNVVGQRITSPSRPGIYIVRGKKMVIK